MRRASSFPLHSTFFGLTQEYRNSLFKQIHEIVFHGKGGYSWPDIYNMPVWLRNFTFGRIKDHYDKEKEAIEKANSKSKSSTPLKPNIKPNYKTKIPRK